MNEPELKKRIAELKAHLLKSAPGGRAVLAYSGGVDSTFLLKVISLSGIEPVAIIARSESLSSFALERAAALAEGMGVNLSIIESRELDRPGFVENGRRRCFHCKDELFGLLKKIAEEESCGGVVMDGSNADDTGDWRPGLEAARLHGVQSPLIECGFTKAEIRECSRLLGLSTWNKPASPCLASRIPYGTPVSAGSLEKIEAAEALLRAEGFEEMRVRHHGDIARIEVPAAEIRRLVEEPLRSRVAGGLRDIGYRFVTLDIEGFESGKLNR